MIAARRIAWILPVGLIALFAPPTWAVDGLTARYADGARGVTAVVSVPAFSLLADESPHPAIKPAFTAVWNGNLRIVVAAPYRFDAGGATMTLDGRPVAAAAVELKPGLHPLRIEYRRQPGPARLQIQWSSDTFAPEPLPAMVLQHDADDAAVASWAAVDRGRALVDQHGCRGCHGDRPLARDAHGRGPDLTNVGARTGAAWLDRWLADPVSYRTAARMPAMPITEGERRDLVAFLAQARLTVQGDVTSLFEPAMDAVRRADEESKGKIIFDKVGCAACHGPGAGMIPLDTVGSKLALSTLRTYLLQPGRVDVTGRMPNMALSQAEATSLAAHLAAARAPSMAPDPPRGDERKGRVLFSARGCAGCHDLSIDGTPLRNDVKPPPLTAAGARARRGCLAAAPPPAAPRFRFGDGQRADIAAYLAAPDVARAPAAELQLAVDNFRCGACHEIGAPPLTALSETPPSLGDSGNKLSPSWIRAVIGERVRARSWLGLRMPIFPSVAKLAADGFADRAGAVRADPPPPSAPDAFALREGVRALGRGEEGLACINCHDFAWYKSGSATPAPDMATMGGRIRPDWFRRWMLDPQRIQPGTQMPNYFADTDAGFSGKRISDIWAALSRGPDMPVPEGVTPDDRAVKLSVAREPVLLRTFIVGGGERTLAVGFPGGQSYAFDLDACRLQFAWSGGFLDVRQVWEGRGGQKAVPLGERTYVAPDGFPLRIGDPAVVPRPRFRAYHVQGKIPTLIYDVGGAEVRETITPLRSGLGLSRAFEVRGADAAGVWFLPGPPSLGLQVTARGVAVDAEGRIHAAANKGGTTRFTVLMSVPRHNPHGSEQARRQQR